MHDPTRRMFYQHMMGFFSCFGGGVFLATCLMDLFPEVEEQLTMAFQKLNIKSTFPLSEFIMIIGFLLVLVCEQIVLSWKESNPESHPLLGHSHGDEPSEHIIHRHNSVGSLNGISDHTLTDDFGYSVHEDFNSHSSLRTSLLVLALSLHSVFEGIAIGLQPNVEQIIQVLVAVLIHKSIIAFTLGLNVVQSRLRIRAIVECIVLFTVMSPLGVGIGMAVINFDKGVEVFLVSGILQGLACGTFLYVTFFEVLPHELNSGNGRLLKLLCVILGFSVASMLIMFLPS